MFRNDVMLWDDDGDGGSICEGTRSLAITCYYQQQRNSSIGSSSSSTLGQQPCTRLRNPHNCRLIVSPVKKSDSFRLNGMLISSDSSSLLLSSSSPKMMVRVYGGDGLSGSSGSKKPGLRMMFGMRSSVVHSSASMYLYFMIRHSWLPSKMSQS